MDLSDYLKMKFREMHRTTKASSNATKQEKAEKRKSLRAKQLLARRNIDDGMSPYCTPLVEKKSSQNPVHRKPPSAADMNRLKLLEQWKVNKAKEKEMEKAKQKPIFKFTHLESSLSVNLENVNKLIKGQPMKKSQFAPENHKFRAPRGIKPIEFRCQSTLSKALDNASKPQSKPINKFQKASYRSDSLRNKNTIDGIGKKNIVKSTSSLGSGTNIIRTRSTAVKPAEGYKNNKQPARNLKITDKPEPSAYNTRANVRAKVGSTSTSSLEQSKAKNTSKSGPKQIEKYVSCSSKLNKLESTSSKLNKLESNASKTSTVGNSKSQTTPRTSLRNRSKPSLTTTHQEPTKAKATPNFVSRNVRSSSANKHSKLGLNASKTNTCNNSKIQTTPMTVTGIKRASTSRVTPLILSGLENKSKPALSSKTIQPKTSKSQVTPKIDTGLRRGTSCPKIISRTKKNTPKITLDIPDRPDSQMDHGDVLANKTPENIKEANTKLIGAPAYISPFVTVSRGKRSARDEFKARKSLNKDTSITVTPENLNTLTSAQAGAKYFRAKLDSEIVRISAKCSEWENYLTDPELPEEAQSSIGVTIGQSKLLVSKKFQQFRGLINQCMTQNYEEKEITCEDLHGFWDMIYMQVENLDTRFENLHKLKDNNWSELMPEQVEVVKKLKDPVKKIKVKKPESKTRTGIRDMIKAAREKQKGNNQEENVFSGGYFEVRTPVKDRINTPRSSTNKRRSRLSVLTEGTASSSSSPLGLTLMKLSQSIKQNNGLTPSKSILKVNSKHSTGKKKVVFEDTISTKNIRKTILFTKDIDENTDFDNVKISTKESDKENTPVRRSSRLLSRAHE